MAATCVSHATHVGGGEAWQDAPGGGAPHAVSCANGGRPLRRRQPASHGTGHEFAACPRKAKTNRAYKTNTHVVALTPCIPRPVKAHFYTVIAISINSPVIMTRSIVLFTCIKMSNATRDPVERLFSMTR